MTLGLQSHSSPSPYLFIRDVPKQSNEVLDTQPLGLVLLLPYYYCPSLPSVSPPLDISFHYPLCFMRIHIKELLPLALFAVQASSLKSRIKDSFPVKRSVGKN